MGNDALLTVSDILPDYMSKSWVNITQTILHMDIIIVVWWGKSVIADELELEKAWLTREGFNSELCRFWCWDNWAICTIVWFTFHGCELCGQEDSTKSLVCSTIRQVASCSDCLMKDFDHWGIVVLCGMNGHIWSAIRCKCYAMKTVDFMWAVMDVRLTRIWMGLWVVK